MTQNEINAAHAIVSIARELSEQNKLLQQIAGLLAQEILLHRVDNNKYNQNVPGAGQAEELVLKYLVNK